MLALVFGSINALQLTLQLQQQHQKCHKNTTLRRLQLPPAPATITSGLTWARLQLQCSDRCVGLIQLSVVPVTLMLSGPHGTNTCVAAAVDRAYVEETLTNSFRSHAAVTPHDWQTYEEMRSLAQDKYHLHIGAVDLPTQASDQSKVLDSLHFVLPA